MLSATEPQAIIDQAEAEPRASPRSATLRCQVTGGSAADDPLNPGEQVARLSLDVTGPRPTASLRGSLSMPCACRIMNLRSLALPFYCKSLVDVDYSAAGYRSHPPPAFFLTLVFTGDIALIVLLGFAIASPR